MASNFGICKHEFVFRQDYDQDYTHAAVIINTVPFQACPMNPPFPASIDVSKQHLLLVVRIATKSLVAVRVLDATEVCRRLRSACINGARRGFVLEIEEQDMAKALSAARTRLVDYGAYNHQEELQPAIASMQIREECKALLELAANDAVEKMLCAFAN